MYMEGVYFQVTHGWEAWTFLLLERLPIPNHKNVRVEETIKILKKNSTSYLIIMILLAL